MAHTGIRHARKGWKRIRILCKDSIGECWSVDEAFLEKPSKCGLFVSTYSQVVKPVLTGV